MTAYFRTDFYILLTFDRSGISCVKFCLTCFYFLHCKFIAGRRHFIFLATANQCSKAKGQINNFTFHKKKVLILFCLIFFFSVH